MSLKIYCGSRIENLAEKLKERLLEERQGKDPFVFTKVVVPNGNLAKWLQIRMFAKEPDLCAGIQFPFMEKELTELMKAGLPPKDRADVELLPDHAYAKAIVSILLAGPEEQPEYDKLAPFRKYIMNSDSADAVAITEQKQAAMTWQLADKLADLMDSYEVYRPEIVEAWLGTGKCSYDLRKGETAEAEAALARALWGEKGKFKQDGKLLSLRQLYNRVKDNAPDEKPKTIYFFGQSTLSYLQAQILVWLAKTHNVVVFYRNPCREFWGDIETKNEERKALFRVGRQSGDDPEKEYGDICENELLKTLGIAGRETLRLLVDLEESGERIGFDWESIDNEEASVGTVLGNVQESIRCRTSEVTKCRQDASVQVVGTPGVRREVEMVYNSILGAVWKTEESGERPWGACSFSDIAVIVPDMQTYRPVIEAVFDARGEVPYGLLDTSASDDSNYLRGFLSLIELGRKGLNRERLFNVLENPCVQRALGFARADVVSWRELTEKIGAFDGFEHDDENGLGYFDWSSALKRLRLARLADKVGDGEGGDLPLVNDGGDTALKLSEVVELLYRDLTDTLFDGSGRPRALPLLDARRDDGTRADCWAERLVRLAKTYLAVEKDNKLENKVCPSVIGTLYSLGDISGDQGFELAASAVEHFVGGIPCRKGSFLTSGVTIGGFSSLSAVPFKQVYMMGMGAGGFPGRASDSTLDVRGTGWRLGDVSIPNRNRFLFLESIMSVRDRLVLSYPNKDIEKDAELFPSGIVLDVEKFIGNHVLDYDAQTEEKERKFQEFKNYPLLERGEAVARKEGEKRPTDDIVWVEDDPFAGLLPTYSKAARELARARVEGKGAKPEVKAATEEKAKPRVELSAKVLAEFLKNPVRAVMRYRFGISVAGYLETDLGPDSPLGSLDGPDEWNLQSKWLDPDAASEVKKEFRRLQLAGKMPTGFLGEYAKSAILQKAEAGLDGIKDFIADFALSDGKDNTLHLDSPAEFGTGGADELKVRFVAEIPNWKETDDEVSVLVTGWLGKQAPKLPSERCFDAFLAYLMGLHSGKCTAQRLKIGVVDLTNGTTSAWTWSGIDAEKAGKYLERVARSFLTYESAGEHGRAVAPRPPRTARGAVPTDVMAGENKMVDFTCKKLLKVLDKAKQPYDWADMLERLTAEEFDNSDSSFNNDLVLEQNLERFKREPETGEELKGIYEDRYELPLSGIRMETAEKEADHE